MKEQDKLKTFSTSPQGHKRKGHSPVRNRCLEFVEILQASGFTRSIPLDQAKQVFQTEMGIMDQKSIAAYFGIHEHKTRQKMERFAQYGSGHSAIKRIELSYEVHGRKGYFEILNLATIEMKGHTWFMTFNSEGLVPLLAQQHERSSGSIDKISLSFSQGERVRENRFEKVVSPINGEAEETREIQTNNNILDQREKLSLEKIDTNGSTSRKKCLGCGKVDSANPYRILCPRGLGYRTRQDVCVGAEGNG